MLTAPALLGMPAAFAEPSQGPGVVHDLCPYKTATPAVDRWGWPSRAMAAY